MSVDIDLPRRGPVRGTTYRKRGVNMKHRVKRPLRNRAAKIVKAADEMADYCREHFATEFLTSTVNQLRMAAYALTEAINRE